MKAIMIFITFLFLMGGLSAQEKKKDKETKAEKAIRLESEFQSTSQLINDRHFVLEADSRSNQRGYTLQVSSTLNFIKVDSTLATIQTGNNYRIGYNGVGGITTEGNISKWKVIKDNKRKNFVISMSVSTTLGFYDIFINVSSSGNASATISGITSGKLIYQGRLIPLDETRTYKGSTI